MTFTGNIRKILISVVTTALLYSPDAIAGLAGDTVTSGYGYGFQDLSYLSGGPTQSQLVPSFGSSTVREGNDDWNVTVTDTTITIDQFWESPNTAYWLSDGDFVGVILALTSSSGVYGFTDIPSISSNVLDGSPRVTLNPDYGWLMLNFAGMATNATSSVVLTFQSASTVPEPASYTVMLAGLLMIGFAVLRKGEIRNEIT